MTSAPEMCLDELLRLQLDGLAPSRAFFVASRLGSSALWLLRPEVLEKAAEFADHEDGWRQPSLADGFGACWVPAVCEHCANYPLLRDAVVLPLYWLPGRQSHHPRLPQDLRHVADEVVAALRESGEIKAGDSWGLFPAEDGILEGPGQSFLEGSYPSAWVPLAAGLLLAAGEGRPDRTVWATGAWKAGAGVCGVAGLREKLALAAEFGAKAFFVPESNLEEAQALATGMEILPLERAKASPRESLRNYLGRFRLKPTGDAPQAERRAYYLNLQDHSTAQRFYFETILPEVKESLAKTTATARARRLVTIVSKGFSLVDLAIGLVGPEECLLLHDAEMKSHAYDIRDRINSQWEVFRCEVQCQKFGGEDHDTLVCEYRRYLEKFFQRVSPHQMAVDLTAGKRAMNLALYDAAPPGCRVFVWQADFERGRPVPFSERAESWLVAGRND